MSAKFGLLSCIEQPTGPAPVNIVRFHIKSRLDRVLLPHKSIREPKESGRELPRVDNCSDKSERSPEQSNLKFWSHERRATK